MLSPLTAIAATMLQSLMSNDHAVADVNSPDSLSTTNPFGDRRPMAASQSGRTSSGKKLPPIINNGNISSDVIRLAALEVGNTICSTENHANKPMPDNVIQIIAGKTLFHIKP